MTNWKRTFAIIWTGQFFSILSSSIVGYAIIFWLSAETRSAEVLALAVIAAFLPQILLGPIAGAYVDRWDRKRTMIFSDTFIALCTLLLAALFWWGKAETWHIYLLLACRSVGSAFHMPSMQASVPLLAPETQLTRIAGVNQAIQSLCNIAAPGIGALLIGFYDMGSILLLDVAGAAIACISLLFVVIPRPERLPEAPHLLREVRDGVRAILAERGLAWLSLFAVIFFFVLMPLSALFPLLTLEHYGGDIGDMGLVETLWGGGALLGGAVMGWRVWKVNKAGLINISYIVVGAYMIAAGALHPEQFGWFVGLTAFGGLVASIEGAAFVAIMQSHIAPELLGRAMSLYFSASMLPAMLGVLATGWLADEFGLTPPFIAGGILIVLVGICSFLSRSLMAVGRLKS